MSVCGWFDGSVSFLPELYRKKKNQKFANGDLLKTIFVGMQVYLLNLELNFFNIGKVGEGNRIKLY